MNCAWKFGQFKKERKILFRDARRLFFVIEGTLRGYSSKKRAMTSSITDDCGVWGACFFREAPVWCRADRACGDGAPGCGAAIGSVPYRDWLCKPVEEYGDDNAVLNSGCGGSVRAADGRLSTSVLRSALYAWLRISKSDNRNARPPESFRTSSPCCPRGFRPGQICSIS